MFCKNCGQELPQNTSACGNCGCPINQGTAFCERCGLQSDGVSVFCAGCGAPMPTQQSSQAQPQPQQNTMPQKPPKSKMAAGLLGIFLGCFGVHNFYLGYTSKGIAQLVITVVTCGAGAIVSEIWGLIEGIMILTGSINCDADGVPLVD